MSQRTYIGARYVPLIMGEWDNTVSYEPLSIVFYNGNSFTSRTFVPVGIPISNENYWALTSLSNAGLDLERQERIAGDAALQSQINLKMSTPAESGTNGQILTLQNGANVWSNAGTPTDAQVETAVNSWLGNHPEATTTVEDGSITTAKIADGAVTDEKLYHEKLDVDYSKNIFNANSSNKITGAYANATSGKIQANANYEIIMMPIEGSSVISFNSALSGAHIAFYTDYLDITEMVVGNTISGYIDGFANEAKQGFTVPATANAMTVSVQIANANSAQIEYGESSTSYERYQKGLYASKIIGELPGYFSVLEVGASKQFQTISAAVAAALDNDVIVVYPGTYTESVAAWNKFIHIIGMSRDECVLTYSGGDYNNPPLEMSHGTLANMTIIATAVEQTEHSAYALHVEDDSCAGSSFQISNVRFVNYERQTVGIGLRNNYTIEFVNCEFVNHATKTDYSPVALYVHDHETATINEDNQRINLINCSFENNNSTRPTILLQSQEILGNRATCRFQRNIIKNLGNGPEIEMIKYDNRDMGGGNFLNSTDWLLDEMSALNTLNTVNA